MQTALLLSFCAVLLVVALCAFRRRGSVSLPPGPKGLPILGSLLDVPSKLLFLKLDEWAKEYGPVYSYSLLGQPIIVVNTAQAAGDILDRLSSKTSDRPRMIKVADHMCRNLDFGFMPRNDTWRRHRRAAHETLNIRATEMSRPVLEEEARVLVEGFLQHPEIDLVDHLNRFSSSVAWRVIFGHQVIPLEGPNPSAPLDGMVKEFAVASVPGKSIVDILPFLNPIISRSKLLRAQSDRFYARCTAFFTGAFLDPQVQGTASLSSNLKDHGEKLGLTNPEECGWIGAGLFMAAQETTATALGWFTLAMLLYPDVAAAAQAELKAVVGDRPPSFADHLPRIEAIVKEVLRWRPPAPFGLPHAASEAFTYGDWAIPAGAIIMGNLWTICRDPLLYKDAENFDPSRFIDEKGQVKNPLQDSHEDYLAFGYGRRICVGKNLASDALFISIASLLWAFDFKKGRDAQGEEIIPNESAFEDNGLTLRPESVAVVLVPRIPGLAERLRAS